jgi:hypothetical protein
LVWGKLHLENEPYSKSGVEIAIVPLEHRGALHYINMRRTNTKSS